MRKKISTDANRSSESCKNNSNSNSHNLTESSRLKSGDDCNSSSESSCGQGFQRKRLKGHGDLQCRFFSSKNRFPRKWCKHSVFPHGWTENTCCHNLKETQCFLKKQRCQHCPAKFSNCFCSRYLPCSCWNSSHHSNVLDQETNEMTGGHCHQMENLCSLRRNNNCGHCCPHGHEASGQGHLNLAGYNCTSSHCKEIPNSFACVNARLEKDLLPVGVDGISKGDLQSENITHGMSQEKSWLTLNVARPPKPSIADFNVHDISLGLPVNLSSQAPQFIQNLDLNISAEDNTKSSMDMCAPEITSSRNSEMKMPETSQELVNDKDIIKGEVFGCESHQNQDDIIVLDDSDEGELHNDDQKLNVVDNEAERVNHKGDIALLVKEEVSQSVDVCSMDVSVAKSSFSCEGVNVASIGNQSEKKKAVALVEKSVGLCESQKETNFPMESSIRAESSQMILTNSSVGIVHTDHQGLSPRGFKSRKKRVVDKMSLPLLDLEESDDEANASNATVNMQTTVQEAVLSKMVEAKPRMWENGTLCDLCRKGPSLFLGEWYAWCCGLRLSSCCCSLDVKMRLTLSMISKKTNRPRKTDGIPWSGKVHKMCALWSAEVYEEGEGLQGLYDAVKRGKLLICAACKEYGATLGCRVNTCRRSFHYPCADELASKLCCRMWDGMQHPVACRGHRHVPETCANAKERPPNLRKWRLRRLVSRNSQNSALERRPKPDQTPSLWSSALKEQPRGVLRSSQTRPLDPFAKRKSVEIPNTIIDISTDSESENKMQNSGVQCLTHGSSSSAALRLKDLNDTSLTDNQLDTPAAGQCWSNETSVPLYYMGSNLLCEDLSCGREAVLIPCTNDVDSDPAPPVNYIIKNRYLGRAKKILDSVLLDKAHAAPSCNGCDINGIDNPHVEPSVHVALDNAHRDSDTRLDWQGRSMLGRLPYDRFGRLQFGVETKDIMECNSHCPCGVDCLNNELQKGIRIPLEVFKTKERGWGVRTMDQICRGKFVVEYIGEVLTHDEAYLRGVQYDLSNFSCLFSADHPDVPTEDLLVIDGFRMSNVARFINHSCDGNLGVFRVYTETTNLRFCRIGLYALRDIEIGEELTYDYSYVTSKDTDKNDFSMDPTSIRCMCGASNCRKWLWTGATR